MTIRIHQSPYLARARFAPFDPQHRCEVLDHFPPRRDPSDREPLEFRPPLTSASSPEPLALIPALVPVLDDAPVAPVRDPWR